MSQPQLKNTYHLKHYYWRSFLTFVGPLLTFGFYVFICQAFLRRTPSNDIVLAIQVDARWVYYTWFIVAILMLDWSKAGLANIEAASLMHPRLAPFTATRLMWHTDNKWANPVWWFHAVLLLVVGLLRSVQVRLSRSVSSEPVAEQVKPGGLWILLSMATIAAYVALPLSGLTMEIDTIRTISNEKATILGPNADTFNLRQPQELQHQIRNFWDTGRPTTPLNNTILYATKGTKDVSEQYFNDQAAEYANFIEIFSGPKVLESVVGSAWGVYANISCIPVLRSQLQLLKFVDMDHYQVRGCLIPEPESQQCDLEWYTNTSLLLVPTPQRQVAFPVWLDETDFHDELTQFSIVAAADGAFLNSQAVKNGSPYNQLNNHDNLTLDSLTGKRPSQDTTTAIFEMFIWEGSVFGDAMLLNLTSGMYPGPVEIANRTWKGRGMSRPTVIKHAGIGVHCDVTTMTGRAELDPVSRTFSAFERDRARGYFEIATTYNRTAIDMYPPQILAISTLAKQSGIGSVYNEWSPRLSSTGFSSESTWVNLHKAIGAPFAPQGLGPDLYTVTKSSYRALEPRDLQYAVYKLLGESVITLTNEGVYGEWEGDLYTLKSTSYLVPGIVSWISVLVFLALWATVMAGGALWTILFAGPRWAPTLGGFELFKFGAQYSQEVNDLEALEFQGCRTVLDHIPGTVGMLPGDSQGAQLVGKLGFIGLSENVADKRTLYTLDRRQAASTRPI